MVREKHLRVNISKVEKAGFGNLFGPQKKTVKITVPNKGENYRMRIRPPSLFKKKTIRTIDIGKPGGTQIVGGRLKKNGWATQSVLMDEATFRKKFGMKK